MQLLVLYTKKHRENKVHHFTEEHREKTYITTNMVPIHCMKQSNTMRQHVFSWKVTARKLFLNFVNFTFLFFQMIHWFISITRCDRSAPTFEKKKDFHFIHCLKLSLNWTNVLLNLICNCFESQGSNVIINWSEEQIIDLKRVGYRHSSRNRDYLKTRWLFKSLSAV